MLAAYPYLTTFVQRTYVTPAGRGHLGGAVRYSADIPGLVAHLQALTVEYSPTRRQPSEEYDTASLLMPLDPDPGGGRWCPRA